MIKKIYPRLFVLASLLLIAGWMLPRMTFQPESRLWIEGTSTMHDWKIEVGQFDGTLEALSADNVKSLKVTVPVAELKGKNGTMDKKTMGALKAETHPEITFELKTSEIINSIQNGKFELDAIGNLTIAGVTKPVTFSVKGEQLADGRVRYTGSTPVLMSDFGMKPPTAMLGAMKTGDRVVVHFDVVSAL